MLNFPRWKVWLVLLATVTGIIAALPSLLPEKTRDQLPGWLKESHINLGLDLSGGSHLLLEADTTDVRKQQIERMEETIRTEMRRASPEIEISDISTANGELSFMPRNPAQLDQAVDLARQQTNGIGIGGARDWTVAVQDSTRIVMKPTEAGINFEIDSGLQSRIRPASS